MVEAASGSVEDIQAAVDLALSIGDIIVLIPEGTWDFNAVGVGVSFEVPIEGFTIIGAGSDKTILQMPVDDSAPNTVMIQADGGHKVATEGPWVSGGPLRVTGITFRGRPNIDTSPTGDVGVQNRCAKNFRVDHCDFHWMGAVGVAVADSDLTYGVYGGDPAMVSQGVVDHCNFYDLYKPVALQQARGYAYGIMVARAYSILWTLWEPSMWEFFGKYNRNVFVEDCYFYNCRHATNVFCGGIMVFRHNLIESDISGAAFHMLDLHPSRGSGETGVYSGRGFEIYDVVVQTPFTPYEPPTHRISGSDFAGGSGLIYNTRFEKLMRGVLFEGPEGNPIGYEKTRQKEWFIWNINYIDCLSSEVEVYDNGFGMPVEWNGFGGEPESWYAMSNPNIPPWNRGYTPYPYPHPLTQGIVFHTLNIESVPVLDVPFIVRRVG